MFTPRPSLRITRGFGVVALALVLGPAGTGAVVAQPSALEPYALVDRWPHDPPALAGVIRDPQGLDVDRDDRVYVSDMVVGGVLVVTPDGTFLPPIGAADTTGPGRLAQPGRLVVDQERERLYVLDNGTDRVVAYGLDGTYVLDWPTPGVGISTSPDGRVYVADGEANAIKVFDPNGKPVFAFGSLGTGNGEFSLLEDVSVSPDGAVVAVGDRGGLRLQLFDIEGTNATFRRDWDLQRPEYSQYEQAVFRGLKTLAPFFHCRADVVFALGGDSVWVGDGGGSCWLRPDSFDYTIATSAAQGSICKRGVIHPRVRPATSQFVALGTYDPNVGPCWSPIKGKDTRLPTTPAVLRFETDHFRRVSSITLAAQAPPDGTLVGPVRISMPVSGELFVQDASAHAHIFGANGAFLSDTGTRDVWKPGRTQRLSLGIIEGGPVQGEVFASFVRESFSKRPGLDEAANWHALEHGFGRYRSVIAKVYGRDVLVVEPIWEKAEPIRFENEVIDLTYDRTVDELAVLYGESTMRGRLSDTSLIYYQANDGVRLRTAATFESTRYGLSNIGTISDLGLSPDGRAFVLDDATATVHVVAAGGGVVASVPTAGETRKVAGGPGDTYFTLLRSGYVERRRLPDGALTARFDARPHSRSDPAVLTDLVVDEAGRVYVADGQSNQVLVFAPDTGLLARPPGPECLFAADKRAAPNRVPLGGTTGLALTLAGRCGIGAVPSDIVVIAQWVPQEDMRQITTGLDFAMHRAAVIEVGVSARLVQGLTHDRATLVKAMGKADGSGDGTNLPSAFGIAQQQFTAGDGRRHVIFILNTTYCTPLMALQARQCVQSGGVYRPAEEAAADAAASGTVVAVKLPDSCRTGGPGCHTSILASRADAVIPTGADAIPYLLEFVTPGSAATNVEITDRLPANMRLVPGSPRPAATQNGAELRWELASLPDEGASFALDVIPQEVGRWPTNVEALATFTDGWGHPQRIVFPVPEVEVLGAEPTPTGQAPSATRTVNPTPTGIVTPATTVGGWRRIFLPWSVRGVN